MMKKQTEMEEQNELTDNLKVQLSELEKTLEEKKLEKKEIKQELKHYKQEFINVQQAVQKLAKIKNQGIAFMKAIPAYALGRRNLKRLYSTSFKQKDAANQLKKYKYHLYSLGFIEKSLSDLDSLFMETDNFYLKKAIAWEFALWNANKLTKNGSKLALEYLDIYLFKEEDPANIVKATILQAEAYEILGLRSKGMEKITEILKSQQHPDLFLAAANLGNTVKDRLNWINKTLELYNLKEVSLSGKNDNPAYFNLHTARIQESVMDGPKVSVIIPAYNSELGIRIAIESILSQTWGNLEILVVDDCSTDNTANIVAEYVQKDDRIKLLSTGINSGPYIARNIALKEATGEFITINDADDWSHPQKIEIQAEHLIKNKNTVANTSEHARLTEELKLYRRGMPGKYIFSNMSSIMFRRNPVLNTIGYWDNVRFAADSEFKKRLAIAFGKENVIDLKTGPLSFPMQSSNSLTGNSAFGYKGFLMGVRKEYAEVHNLYHKRATSLYFPFEQKERAYPVPEPMWPDRETKRSGNREFDIVFISDFRQKNNDLLEQIQASKEMGMKTGLIQRSSYHSSLPKEIDTSIRQVIDGELVQMLVYGESIKSRLMIINNPAIFQEKQKYIPAAKADVVRVIITQSPGTGDNKIFNIRECARHIHAYTKQNAKWYPINHQIRDDLLENHVKEIKSISLSTQNWLNEDTGKKESFASFVEGWLVEDIPLQLP